MLRGISDKEVRLVHECPPKGFYERRAKALALLLLDTGLRIDEAITLRRADVNWDDLSLRVTGKGRKERVVPFSTEMRKDLWRFDSAAGAREFAFAPRHGHGTFGYRNAYSMLTMTTSQATFHALPRFVVPGHVTRVDVRLHGPWHRPVTCSAPSSLQLMDGTASTPAVSDEAFSPLEIWRDREPLADDLRTATPATTPQP